VSLTTLRVAKYGIQQTNVALLSLGFTGLHPIGCICLPWSWQVHGQRACRTLRALLRRSATRNRASQSALFNS
jgi:hypothetical protein